MFFLLQLGASECKLRRLEQQSSETAAWARHGPCMVQDVTLLRVPQADANLDELVKCAKFGRGLEQIELAN